MTDTITHLNQILADQHVLLMQYRNFHWNVTGIHFMPLHELFEAHYDELFASIDEVAERIKTLKAKPLSTLKEILDATNISETYEKDGTAMIQTLVKGHTVIIDEIKSALDGADAGTESFFGGLLEQHEKTRWLLESHL